MIDTAERERRRLAQDLHDRTAGGLTSVLFALRRLERELADEGQRAQLSEAREGVAAAIEDVRDLIADLRPKVLDDFGLGPALERLCETVARRSGLAVRAELGNGLDNLGADVATAVYRIVQEALGNVVRHAGARTVGVDGGDHRRPAARHRRGRRAGLRPGQRRSRDRGHDRARAHGRGAPRVERPAGGGARVRFEATIGAT